MLYLHARCDSRGRWRLMESVKGIKNQFNNKNNNDEIHSFILRLNVSKYRKLIIHILQTLFPRILSLMLPCRVSSFSSLIRVVLCNDLDTYDDVNVALTSCSRSLYASPPLRSRAWPASSCSIHEVTTATTISRLLYAAPAV